ncbi:hypothetical protein Rs2_19256 [Raphanus sativus]|nr:hypothetical protein Rs2_19256 [Raphanus sativus]
MREEVETSAPPPQLSAMFQKLAMAVKTKTFDFFTEEDEDSINKTKTLVKPTDTQMGSTLISSLFATVSSFVEETVEAADRALVSSLAKLSDLKRRFWRRRNHRQSFDLGSCLESRVQENQSKLRALGTVSNRLQGEMDGKDSLVSCLRRKLSEVFKV